MKKKTTPKITRKQRQIQRTEDAKIVRRTLVHHPPVMEVSPDADELAEAILDPMTQPKPEEGEQ
jgi:hypothetical protein